MAMENESWTFWICMTYWKWGIFQPAMLVYQRVDLPLTNARLPGIRVATSHASRLSQQEKRGRGTNYTKSTYIHPWKGVETPQKIGEPSPYSHCQLGRIWSSLTWKMVLGRRSGFLSGRQILQGGKPLRLREGAGNQPLFTMFFSWVQVWLSMVMCMNNNNNNNKKKKKNLYIYFHVKSRNGEKTLLLPEGEPKMVQFLGHYCTRRLPSRKLTYPPKMAFWRWFPFPKVGYVNTLEGRPNQSMPFCFFFKCLCQSDFLAESSLSKSAGKLQKLSRNWPEGFLDFQLNYSYWGNCFGDLPKNVCNFEFWVIRGSWMVFVSYIYIP